MQKPPICRAATQGERWAYYLRMTARLANLFVFLTGCTLATLAQAQAHCKAPFALGELSRTYSDPDRANRAVAVLIRFPAASAGASTPLAGCAFPRIAVGHGFTIPGNRYGYLATRVARLGYVMVFPRTEEGIANHLSFALDLNFALRALSADPAFANVLADSSALIGHSMGGGAGFLAAALAPNHSALIGLAPAETNPSAITAAASITVPTLILTGSLDCVTPFAQHAQPLFAALATAPARRKQVDLVGGSHCQFSDGWFTCSIGESGCTAATLTASEQQALAASEIAAFLQRFVRAGELFVSGFEG